MVKYIYFYLGSLALVSSVRPKKKKKKVIYYKNSIKRGSCGFQCVTQVMNTWSYPFPEGRCRKSTAEEHSACDGISHLLALPAVHTVLISEPEQDL